MGGDKQSYTGDKQSYTSDKQSYTGDKQSYTGDKQSYTGDKQKYSDEQPHQSYTGDHNEPSDKSYMDDKPNYPDKSSKQSYTDDQKMFPSSDRATQQLRGESQELDPLDEEENPGDEDISKLISNAVTGEMTEDLSKKETGSELTPPDIDIEKI